MDAFVNWASGQIQALWTRVTGVEGSIHQILQTVVSKNDAAVQRQLIESSTDAKMATLKRELKEECAADTDRKVAAVKEESAAKIVAVEEELVEVKAELVKAKEELAILKRDCVTERDVMFEFAAVRGHLNGIKADVDGGTIVPDGMSVSLASAAQEMDQDVLPIDFDLDDKVNFKRLKPTSKRPTQQHVLTFIDVKSIEEMEEEWSVGKARRVANMLADAECGRGKAKGRVWNGYAQYICYCAGLKFRKKPDGKGGQFFNFETNEEESGRVDE